MTVIRPISTGARWLWLCSLLAPPPIQRPLPTNNWPPGNNYLTATLRLINNSKRSSRCRMNPKYLCSSKDRASLCHECGKKIPIITIISKDFILLIVFLTISTLFPTSSPGIFPNYPGISLRHWWISHFYTRFYALLYYVFGICISQFIKIPDICTPFRFVYFAKEISSCGGIPIRKLSFPILCHMFLIVLYFTVTRFNNYEESSLQQTAMNKEVYLHCYIFQKSSVTWQLLNRFV